MAVPQGKRPSPGTQGRRRAHAATKNKRPALPKPVITRHGKTTIRRYPSRRFYRFEEIKGKPVDFIEFFTAGEYHAIDVRFQDKTSLHFVIDPCFTLKTDYADWKTGDWRPIKRWPLIRSVPLHS